MNENTFLNKKLNIAMYTDDIKEYNTYKKLLSNDEITLITPNVNFDKLNKVSLIIILKMNDKLIKYCSDNNIIILSNIKKKYSNVYFNDTDELIKYLKLIQSNFTIFTIIIPIVSDIDEFKKTLKTILAQPVNNYKLQICICSTLYNENIYKLNELKRMIKIIFHIVDDNSSKYANINSIVKTIDSEYFMIIDSGSKFIKNKLLHDFICAKINNDNKYYVIQNKCIINNKDTNTKTKKVSIIFSEKNVIWNRKIFKKIGYFCNNRFGSDEEYLIRAKYFIGNEYFYTNDIITLSVYSGIGAGAGSETSLGLGLSLDLSLGTESGTCDINELNSDEEKKKNNFINRVCKIIKQIPNTKIYFNKYFDYFSDTEHFINPNNKNQVNFSQYKSFYYDLTILNDFELSKHWINYGKDEGRLSNEILFYKSFPNFDCGGYMKKNKYNIKFESIEYVMGWVYLKNKSTYLKWLGKNNYILNDVSSLNPNPNSNFNPVHNLYNFEEYIVKYKIKYIQVSEKVYFLKKRFIDKFNLMEYNKLSDKFENVLFVGLFDKLDYMLVTEHIGNKYLMWEGRDIYDNDMSKFDIVEKISHYANINHLSVSDNIHDSLSNFEICPININLNIVNTNIFKPINNNKQCVFIYNGFGSRSRSGLGFGSGLGLVGDKVETGVIDEKKRGELELNNKIYSKNIYKNIIKLLPKFEYIFSDELNVSYEKMPEIYSKCFIGINLVKFSGIDYMVQEMNSMNIPVIFNGVNGIKWIDTNDIITNIKTQNNFVLNNNLMYKKMNSDNGIKYVPILDKLANYDEVIECDFFNCDVRKQDLEKIYKNIDNFVNLFSNGSKILFICGDYPGYGGAATNCNDIQTFFNDKNFKTFAIYFNYQTDNNKKYSSSNKMKIVEQCELNVELNKLNLNFKPDIIILKSNISINLKKIFKCPIFFLIPGIFGNNLDKHYTKLNVNNFNEYINHNVITNIKNYDASFTNSSHTKNILYNVYELKTHLFYSSFVQYHNYYDIGANNFDDRKYTYGIIASDFDRKIKNVEHSINTLSKSPDVILIGKNSEKYAWGNFTCIENVEHENLISYYQNIKYIVQDSFYESCSNVKIEAFMNGCKNINSSTAKKLQIISKPIELKNILFISYVNKDGNDKINKIIEISNTFSNVNMYILIITDDEGCNVSNMGSNMGSNDGCNGEQSNIYVHSLNNDFDDLKYLSENKFEKIYLFDYKLPFLLDKKFPENKYLICLFNTDDYNIDKDMICELNNYHVETVMYNEINSNSNSNPNVNFCYKLVNSVYTYDNNKYMKYNIDNGLLNTLIILDYD